MSERQVAVRRHRLRERTRASGVFNEHLALAASGALVLLSVIRVYYFAALNPDVALTVLSVTNRTQVLVSTLLNVIVVLAPFLVFLQPLRQWLFGGMKTGAAFSVKLRTGLLIAPLTPVMASTISIVMLLAFAVGGVFAWISRRRKKIQKDPGAAEKPSRFAEDRQWIAVIIVGMMLAATIGMPWQPLERVKLSSSNSPTIGYVIGEQSGKTLIVDVKRQPTWTKSDDITSRELCVKEPSWMNASLTSLVFKLQDRQFGVDCS